MYQLKLKNNNKNQQLLWGAIEKTHELSISLQACIEKAKSCRVDPKKVANYESLLANIEKLVSVFELLKKVPLIKDKDFEKIKNYCAAIRLGLEDFFSAFFHIGLDSTEQDPQTPIQAGDQFILMLDEKNKKRHLEIQILLLDLCHQYTQALRNNMNWQARLNEKVNDSNNCSKDQFRFNANPPVVNAMGPQGMLISLNVMLQNERQKINIELSFFNSIRKLIQVRDNCVSIEKNTFFKLMKEIEHHQKSEELTSYFSLFKYPGSCAIFLQKPPQVASLSKRLEWYFGHRRRQNDVTGKYSPEHQYLFKTKYRFYRPEAEYSLEAEQENQPGLANTSLPAVIMENDINPLQEQMGKLKV